MPQRRGKGSRSTPEGLTLKQSRFIDEYLKDRNWRAAYARAGYNERGTHAKQRSDGYHLLHKPHVWAVMLARRQEIEERTKISQDMVRVELARAAFFDPRRLFDQKTGQLISVVNLPAEVAAVISSIEISEWTDERGGQRTSTKVRFCSKIEALDKLCRHLGMYEDKLRITMGLEKELEAMTDEELRGKLIELERKDYERHNGNGERAPRIAGPESTGSH